MGILKRNLPVHEVVSEVWALQLCTYLSKSSILDFLHAGVQSHFCCLLPVYQRTALHIEICGFGGEGREGKS